MLSIDTTENVNLRKSAQSVDKIKILFVTYIVSVKDSNAFYPQIAQISADYGLQTNLEFKWNIQSRIGFVMPACVNIRFNHLFRAQSRKRW